MYIKRIRPWRIALDKMGPFQERPEELLFEDEEHMLCNLFMLAARNGRGKTTVLEALAFLFGMLSSSFLTDHKSLPPLLSQQEGRAQLDLLLELTECPEAGEYLLSLSYGQVGTQELFTNVHLSDDERLTGVDVSTLTRGRAQKRLRIGYAQDPQTGKLRAVERLQQGLYLPGTPEEETEGEEERARRCVQRLKEVVSAPAQRESFTSFDEGQQDPRPTLLYFTSHRDLLATTDEQLTLSMPAVPEYQVVSRFGLDGQRWSGSLSNLLVWYFWMAPELYTRVRKEVNGFVFGSDSGRGLMEMPRKNPPGIDVRVLGNQKHALELLSSGERNLMQLAVRLGAHATQHTVIVIDELENHLHPSFQRRLVDDLKRLLRERPGYTVIFTTHSRDVVYALDLEQPEFDLVKGGEMLLSHEEAQ